VANKKARRGKPSCSVVVDVAAQTLQVLEGRKVAAQFPVSTSKFGLGFEEGSYRTPTGKFRVAQRIGAGAPAWTIFRARKNTQRLATPGGDEDLVLTRILTLDGLEKRNANTLHRYVYIHGTNQEHLIGTPASHGCVRLRNEDMITLHNMVRTGTPVRILIPRNPDRSGRST
jgi:lipoprotein-anchoring transpeptidase ErfK/SrfK